MENRVSSELSRELSLLHITLMGVGMMIGAGVFVATGIGIGVAGPGGILLAFTLNGLLAFLSVMTYAELSSAIPKAGGGYAFVQHCLGGLTGFISGWISWFAHAVAGSLYAITFSKYTLHFVSELSASSYISDNLIILEKVLAVIVALLFLFINYRGASETGSVGAIITIGQTAVLAFIGAAGIYVALKHPERLQNFDPFLPNGWGKIPVVMGFSLVGYEGYEVITNTAEEAIDAKKNVPKAIFLAVIIVITTYILVAFAAVIAIHNQTGSITEWFQAKGATAFAEAIGQLFPFGNVLVVSAAIFASTSALNATIYSSTRVSFSLGRDGYLPSLFASISQKRKIPHMALIFSGVIILVVAALLPVEVVMAGASIFFIILFSMVTFALIRVRKEQGDELQYGYLIPYFPLIPIISIVGMTLIGIFLFDMGAQAYIIAAIWLISGLVLYQYYGKKHSISKKSPILAAEKNEKALMVSVGNLENLTYLLNLSTYLTEDNESILVNHVVSLPYQTPLSEGEMFAANEKRVLENALKHYDKKPPAKGIISYGHSISRSIIASVRKRNPRLLFVGWRGYTDKQNFTLGSVIDPLVELVSSDLVVVKKGIGQQDLAVKKILYPSRGKSPHTRLAANIVNQLGDALRADVTFLHVYQSKEKEGLQDGQSKIYRGDFHNSIHTVKLIENNDVVQAILDESEDYDMVVLGASAESFMKRKIFGHVPVRIAARCSKTVLIVKQNKGLRSWINRWFF